MTLHSLLERIDEIKPNLIDDTAKCGYISELDTKINFRILGNEKEIIYSLDDGDEELLVKSPFARLYEYYLSAMIDYQNNEMASYNNNMTLFNSEFEEYAKWYIRNNMPKNSGNFFGF